MPEGEEVSETNRLVSAIQDALCQPSVESTQSMELQVADVRRTAPEMCRIVTETINREVTRIDMLFVRSNVEVVVTEVVFYFSIEQNKGLVEKPIKFICYREEGNDYIAFMDLTCRPTSTSRRYSTNRFCLPRIYQALHVEFEQLASLIDT